MTPSLLFFLEGISAVAATLSGLAIARLERRSFADYGLPLNRESLKRGLQGWVLGVAMVSALMGLIAAAGGYSLGNRMLARGDATRLGATYLIGFALLAFFEEFSFRGYLQATLASGIGFWPAAVLLSVSFGAVHVTNSSETSVGMVTAACFGLLAAFSLRRVGGIGLAIGMHAAWDWGLTYLYSVPDSGVSATGHLMRATLRGPAWLTGGLAGPEGSAFAFVVLALAAIAIHFLFPASRAAN